MPAANSSGVCSARSDCAFSVTMAVSERRYCVVCPSCEVVTSPALSSVRRCFGAVVGDTRARSAISPADADSYARRRDVADDPEAVYKRFTANATGPDPEVVHDCTTPQFSREADSRNTREKRGV